MKVKGSIISAFHEARTTMRILTGVVLFFFSWMNIAPAIAAAKDVGSQNTKTLKAQTPLSNADFSAAEGDALSAGLSDLHRELKALRTALQPQRDLIMKQARKRKDGKPAIGDAVAGMRNAGQIATLKDQLKKSGESLSRADADAVAGLLADAAHIKARNLPPVMSQRNDDVTARIVERGKELQNNLAQLITTDSVVGLYDQSTALLGSLQKMHRVHAKFDPSNMPFRNNSPEIRIAAASRQDLVKVLKRPVPSVRGRKTGSSAGAALVAEQRVAEISAAEVAKIADEEHDYVLDRGSVQVASLLPFAAIPLPGPEFTAPTDDAPITPAIQALATQLHNNPVEIYNWVRNSVKWMPTFGSIQGSQSTLDKQAGNSFDTASLLISLLRAAGIPSRYVYGTIDVPVDKLQNWVGGTTDPNAALNILGQGGIPNLGLAQGGAIKAVRLETVWVEAFVDAYPSRGAKNSHPAVWVPMDPSFKQYTYTSGMDVANQVPFDSAGFLQQAKQGATIDNTNGVIQNLNGQNVSAAITTYQAQVQNWVNSQNANPTTGDILGSKKIQAVTAPVLPTNLPYRVEAAGATYSALPSNLRHQFTYSLYESLDAIADDSPMMSFQDFTSNLAEKKITLIYTPSTPNDLAAIKSYLPQPHSDGSPIQPSELPKSIPAYNISVTPELLVEGQVIATGPSIPLGTSLVGQGGFTTPDLSNWDLSQEDHVAGRYSALGLSLGGIAPAQLDAVNTRLASTQSALKSGDLSQITGESMSGDMLTAAIWGYHASIESFSRIAQKQAGIVENTGLSYGFIHKDVSPVEKYGVITAITFPGTLIDVSHLRWLSYAADNTTSKWIGYNLMRGHHASAMEHAALERFTNDPSQSSSVQAVSAVKALAMASQLGQKIFSINSSNSAQIAQLQQSDATIEDVTTAVNNGKQVTIHQSSFSFEGQNWTGYTVIDPATGSGAYLIEGGSRGASEPSPAWDFLASALGGFIDAILAVAKLLATDLAYLYEEPTLGLLKIGELTGALVGVNLVVQILRTLGNDDLSTGGKIATILANLVVSILTIELSELVGAALFVGLADILMFTVIAGLIFSIYLYDLNLLLSYRQPLTRRRFA